MNLRHLFRVETLDARFESKTGEPFPDAQPPRANTVEFYVYYVFFAIFPFLMFKAVYDVSQPEHSSFKHYEHLLSPGWIPGRKVDNSDAQFQSFRNNVPYMAMVLVAHPLLRIAYERVVAPQNQKDSHGDARLQRRVNFDLAFAAIFLIALHGVSALKIFLIMWVNYQIPTTLPKQYVGLTTWTFNIAILFANELCQGYRFSNVVSLLLPPQTSAAGGQPTPNWGAWVDSYGGLIPRWEVLFNITVLRLIAFNFDHLWSHDRRASSPIEKKNLDPTALSERDRVNLGAQPHDFTFRNYLAYILYSPLYLAGPIINFNDYISQTRHPLPSITLHRIIPYAIRFGACLLFMEVFLHHFYVVAIAKSHPDWSIYTPFQLSMLGYMNCHVLWLKLLLPWRFFRLWSLIDGIDPPENQVRCVSDSPSTLAFWRGWHRSFNRWILRYIYIPMGGSQSGSKFRSALNYASVFTFVALWHDINLNLLIWGWMVVFFVVPEVLARMAFPWRKWKDHPNQYRCLCCVGVIGNLFMMMAANLVGFVIGVDGLKEMVNGIVGSFGGRMFIMAVFPVLFVGAQTMFEWRESERRRGIDMKC